MPLPWAGAEAVLRDKFLQLLVVGRPVVGHGDCSARFATRRRGRV